MNVALQVFRADLVEGALVSALQHAPEALNAVGVRHSVDVFTNAMADGLVIEGQPVIAAAFIGVDCGARGRMRGHEAMQGDLGCVGDHFAAYGASSAILGACDSRLADAAASHPHLLRAVLVLFQTADIGLIHFNRTIERTIAIARPRFPDTVEHEPRGALRDANVSMQLHGRNTLERSQAQVDRDGPLAQRDVGPGNRSASADGEVGAAVRAPIGHGLRVRNLASADATALPAAALAVPNHILKPLRCSLFGRKHVHELDHGDAFAVGFAGCFLRHDPASLPMLGI